MKTPEHIIKVTRKVYGVPVNDRNRMSTECRQVAMYLVRKRCGLSYRQIARLFKRCPASVLYACKQIEMFQRIYTTVSDKINKIEKLLNTTKK